MGLVSPIPPPTPTGDHLDSAVPSLMLGAIHDFKHRISANLQPFVPLLSKNKLISRHQSQKERQDTRRTH